MNTIMTDKLSSSNFLYKTVDDLRGYVKKAAERVTSTYEVEKAIFANVLKIGQQSLGYFFEIQGDGDVGKKLTLGDGKEIKRLPSKSKRYYHSIFGRFELGRYCYGEREGQKIECIPLDERLDLPKSDYGYLLQEWSQYMVVEMPYEKTQDLLEKIFSINVPVVRQSSLPVGDNYGCRLVS